MSVLVEGRLRRLWFVVLTAALFGLALPALAPASAAADDTTVSPCDPPDTGGLYCVPDDAGEQFVWPADGWIAANHEYASGSDHGASADIAAPLGTEIRPARAGEVREVTYTQADGWRIQLTHTGNADATWVSSYSHLHTRPSLEEGDSVTRETVIGEVGRLGTADASGPHIHFYLAKETDDGLQRVRIPGLEIGGWAEAGSHITGEYEGLDSVSAGDPASEVEVTEPDGLRAYETTSRSPDDIVAELSPGTELTVQESERGQYRVEIDGTLAWVPHSGTAPSGSDMFGVRSTASSSGVSNVRTEGSTDAEHIGVVPGGSRLTVYETDEDTGWHRVLWRCNETTNRSSDPESHRHEVAGCHGIAADSNRWKYGWISPAQVTTTESFDARSRLANLPLYASRTVDGVTQPDPDERIGWAGGFTSSFRVLTTFNGWYQVDTGDLTGWVRGWHTAGRQ